MLTQTEHAVSHDLAHAERAPIPLRPIETDSGRPFSAPLASLPRALTSLIGRADDVAAARAMLVDHDVRLLTLIGPGGVGKTRLAIRIGEVIGAAFASGVVFVPLAAIVAPELVLPTIMRALGIRESGERSPLEAMANQLRQSHLLLILDNMEHLRDVGPMLVSLLATCPRLSLLVTSRVLLRLSGEHAFPVSPLAIASDRPAAAPAVQLFGERARAVEPSFALTDRNTATIAAVCQQLDGLPLAIELAAARMRVLSPDALLSGLEHRLRLLTDGPRDVHGRLRTMRSAIAWSVDLLTDEERALFRRLGVFVGGFTLEAGEAIGYRLSAIGATMDDCKESLSQHANVIRPIADSQKPIANILDLVTSLVDQSLVQRVETAGGPRFRMLETIQAYALGELTAAGGEPAARDRHAVWCLEFAQRAEPELSGADQKIWFDRLEAELPNMRAALHWLLAKGEAERGLQLASALTWFWSSRSYFREARQWLEAFLALPTTAATRGRGLLEAANILHWLGDDVQAVVCAEESLAIFQQEGDAYLAMCALRRLGSIAIDQRDFARAAQMLAESRLLVNTATPPWDARWDAAFATFLSGRLAVAADRHEEAIACLADASAAFELIGDCGYIAAATGLQGAEWVKLGDAARARAAFATSLHLAGELSDHTWIAWALIGAAHLAHHDGDIAVAMRLLGAATAMRQAIGERRLPENALTPALQAVVESEHFAREWSLGTNLSEDDAIAAALAIFAQRSQPNGDRQPHTLVTAREHEVLCLLAEGFGDKAIAAELGITRRTASQHVAAILTKLDAESRTAAVTRALRLGILATSRPEHP